MSFLFRKKEKKETEEPAATHVSSATSSAVSAQSAALASLEEKSSSSSHAGAEDQEVLAIRNHFKAAGVSKRSFVLGTTLGTGTFGRVRIVTYSLNSKVYYYALKMLKKSEIIRLKQVEHVKNEKNILMMIAHPFIVSLYATFQDERALYMLMEFVIGGELFSLLRRMNRFSNDHARFYAAELCLAFQYLHERNIVYRDLKPENLLLDKEGHLKVTDFGFAKVVPDRTWTLCGTPEYLAPEIIQSKGHGKDVDWWAFGILIFEMLASYAPFYADTPFEIYQKILAGRIEFPRHFDTHAKDLIRGLLTADRTKRYGCLKEGAEQIKNHRWFKGIDWNDVYNRRLTPYYVPTVRTPSDTSNFEQYPESTGADIPLSAEDQALFVDF